MKKLKYQILFTVLMMTIGIAAVTTNIVLSGSTSLTNNPDDFDVYFDYISPNFDTTLYPGFDIVIDNEKSFSFVVPLSKVNETIYLDMYITNASKNYDAEVSYTCDYDNEYILVSKSINSSDSAIIRARSREIATLDVKLIKAYAGEGEISIPVSCTLVATAVERNTQSSDDVFEPLQGRYSVGAEIAIGEEKFNVIRDNGDGTISMLAQSGIGVDFRQSTDEDVVAFLGIGDWGYSDEPREIDIQKYDNRIKEFVNGYVSFLKTTTSDVSLFGDLITLKELGELGCDVPDDYKTRYGVDTCVNSPYADWLLVDYWWWTKSVRGDYFNTLWIVEIYDSTNEYSKGDLSPDDVSLWETGIMFDGVNTIYGYHIEDSNAVRPVITISKAALEGKLITFTIADVSYNAIEGMTWREWVDSSYNTARLVLSGTNIVDEREYKVYDYTNGLVISSNDYINSGSSYKFTNGYQSQ